MFISSNICSPATIKKPSVNFGAIYRITDNSEHEVAAASEKLQNAGMFISRFFQGSDKYLAANEKRGKNGREPGQDASAVAGAFRLRHSSPKAFTSILRNLIRDKRDKGEIKNLSEIDKHPALSALRTQPKEQAPTETKSSSQEGGNPFIVG